VCQHTNMPHECWLKAQADTIERLNGFPAPFSGTWYSELANAETDSDQNDCSAIKKHKLGHLDRLIPLIVFLFLLWGSRSGGKQLTILIEKPPNLGHLSSLPLVSFRKCKMYRTFLDCCLFHHSRISLQSSNRRRKLAVSLSRARALTLSSVLGLSVTETMFLSSGMNVEEGSRPNKLVQRTNATNACAHVLEQNSTFDVDIVQLDMDNLVSRARGGT